MTIHREQEELRGGVGFWCPGVYSISTIKSSAQSGGGSSGSGGFLISVVMAYLQMITLQQLWSNGLIHQLHNPTPILMVDLQYGHNPILGVAQIMS
ncbi:hypothetical protein AVEN_238618-1 [Araneus ventricosus]|uniref:Uncharacterized protein n=1 Tax=Araneus ventricosus TaxID=182803 RepID=A0A4Y2R6F6_ARAVE|nr:hypothetical protein AVEN_238618-1 [Araneus ventricosus]